MAVERISGQRREVVHFLPVHAKAMQIAQARFERGRTVLFEEKIKNLPVMSNC